MSVGGGRGVYPVIFELQIIGDAQVRAAFASLQGQLAQLPAAAGAAGASAANASAAINSMGVASQSLANGISPLNTSLLASSNAMSKLSPAVSTYGGHAALAATTTTKYATTLTSSGVAAVGAAEAADRNAKALGSLSQQQVAGLRNTTGLTLAIAGLSLSGIEAIGMMQAYGETQVTFNERQARVNQLVEDGREGTHAHTLAVMAMERAQRNLGMTLRNTVFATTDMIIFFALIGTNLANLRQQAMLAGKEFSILASIKSKFVGFGEIFTNLPAKLTALGNATHGTVAAQTALAAKAGVLAPALGGVGAASAKNVTIMSASTAALAANTGATLPLATASNTAAVAQTTLGTSAAKNIPIFGAQTVAQIGVGTSAVGATAAMKGLAVAMTTVLTKAGPLLIIFGAIAASAAAVKFNLFGLQDAMIAQHKATDVAIASAADWHKETLKMGQAANIWLFNLLGIENELTEVAEATKIAEESIIAIDAALDRSVSDWGEFNSTVIGAAAGMLEFSGNMDSMNEVWAAMEEGLADGTIGLEQFRAAAQHINEAGHDWHFAMKDMRETTLMFTDDAEAGFTVLMAQMEKLPGALAGAPGEMQIHIDKLTESVDKMGLTVEQKFQLLSELANNTVGPAFASLDQNGQTAFSNIQTYMTNMSNGAIDTGKTFTTVAIELGEGFQYVEDNAAGVVTAIDELNASYSESASVLPALLAQLGMGADLYAENERQLAVLSDGLSEFVVETMKAEDEIRKQAIAIDAADGSLQNYQLIMHGSIDAVAAFVTENEAAIAALDAEASANAEAAEEIRIHTEENFALARSYDVVAEAMGLTISEQDQYLAAIQNLEREYERARAGAVEFARANDVDLLEAVQATDEELVKIIESLRGFGEAGEQEAERVATTLEESAEAYEPYRVEVDATAENVATNMGLMQQSIAGVETSMVDAAETATIQFGSFTISAGKPIPQLDATGQAAIDMGADVATGAGEADSTVNAATQSMNANLGLVIDTMSTVVQTSQLWIMWAETVVDQFEHVQEFAFAPHIEAMNVLSTAVQTETTAMTVAWIGHAQATQSLITQFGATLNSIYVGLMTTVTSAVITGTANMTTAWTNHINTVQNLTATFGSAMNILLTNMLLTVFNETVQQTTAMTIAWIAHKTATESAVTAFAAAVTASYSSFLSSLFNTVSQQTTAMTIAWIGHKLATESVISQLSTSITSTYASMLNIMQSNLGSQLSAMNAMWASHVSAVKSHLTALASAVASTMSSITSSMNQATNAAKELKASIDALQSKTITITTIKKTVTQSSGSTSSSSGSTSTSTSTKSLADTIASHTNPGGSIFQHGFTGFFDSPTRIRVGESGTEFVNVVPMGKGRQNESALHNLVRNNNSRRSGRLVIVSPIYLDGREIARAERRYSFEGISGLT